MAWIRTFFTRSHSEPTTKDTKTEKPKHRKVRGRKDRLQAIILQFESMPHRKKFMTQFVKPLQKTGILRYEIPVAGVARGLRMISSEREIDRMCAVFLEEYEKQGHLTIISKEKVDSIPQKS